MKPSSVSVVSSHTAWSGGWTFAHNDEVGLIYLFRLPVVLALVFLGPP